MPKPRKQQIALEATPYYHCISRCVRRAFLCGEDRITGVSYEHRRGWLESKLLELPDTFAIQVAGYAIMSNHYHMVLFIDAEVAQSWDKCQVVDRWHRLFKGNPLSQRFERGESLSEPESARLDIYIEEWRQRLMSISWFMRILNEVIAREANEEDRCSGRFWEGRFKSQALLDETALAACLAYVDLNPVRAAIAATPETSEHTSIKARIDQVTSSCSQSKLDTTLCNQIESQHPKLLPFVGNPRQEMPKGIPMNLTDYLELVDWTGRIIREDKAGAIPQQAEHILNRIGIDESQWMNMTLRFEECFKTFAGNEVHLRQACERMDYQRVPGVSHCRAATG